MAILFILDNHVRLFYIYVLIVYHLILVVLAFYISEVFSYLHLMNHRFIVMNKCSSSRIEIVLSWLGFVYPCWTQTHVHLTIQLTISRCWTKLKCPSAVHMFECQGTNTSTWGRVKYPKIMFVNGLANHFKVLIWAFDLYSFEVHKKLWKSFYEDYYVQSKIIIFLAEEHNFC